MNTHCNLNDGGLIMGSKERFFCDIMALHPGVTGSCNLVVVKLPNKSTLRFVVDCGLFHEEQYQKLNEELPFNPENIHFTLVTHNHVDHIGRLPYMVKQGFRNAIYATKDTCVFMPLALDDTLHVLESGAKRKRKPVLYSKDDVEQTITQLHPCSYGVAVQPAKHVKVTFFDNGHLLGAAIILVQISYPGFDDNNLLFTGDYNNKNMFKDVEPLPKWVLELPLTVIQESTYGTMDSSYISKCFEKNVRECIEKKGTALIPVFSLGRTQEILYLLKQMQERGDLSVEIPIFLDGKLAIRYTNLYRDGKVHIKEEMRDFFPQNFSYVLDKPARYLLKGNYSTKIILTTSGMGSYGPAQVYIPEYIERDNVLIQFTGYTAEGTLGAKLRNAPQYSQVEIGGIMCRKEARVEYTTEFSAHAKADEMIDFLKQFKKLNVVLVNHGEPKTKGAFAERIMDEVKTKRVGILGEYLFRVNPYKVVKTMSTKF